MSILKSITHRIARAQGFALVPSQALYAYDRGSQPAECPKPDAESSAYLTSANPRLKELRERYSKVNVPASVHSLWTTDYVEDQVNLDKFRAQSAYVWVFKELPRPTQLKYFIYVQDVLAKCPELYNKIDEDGAFGCLCYDFESAGRVSRDRMDSAVEIDFLNRHMGFLSQKNLRVLDVGAGYGRLAQRVSAVAPNLTDYVCLDAVPDSTFLCEFHTKFRKLDKVRVVPLDELIALQKPVGEFDIAFNVHSFSECTYAAIEWWMQKIADLNIPYLFVIPNTKTDFLTTEMDHTRKNFLPLIEKAGYKIVAQEPLFANPDVQKLLSIYDHLFLFKKG